MLDKTCKGFVEILSSKEPVPGGGGAAAYVGAIGTALGSMVANLTLGKKKYAAVEDDIRHLLKRSEKLTLKFEQLTIEDAEAFMPLSAAYRMPSDTEKMKSDKNKAIQSAIERAAQSPINIAIACIEAIELQKEFAQKGSSLALSDAGCGVIFCKAALQAAKLNVLINLNAMENTDIRNRMRTEIDDLCEKGIALADEVYAYVEENI